MTNGSGDGKLRGIGTGRERVERKEGGGKGDFFRFLVLFSTPLENRAPFFKHTP